jgi:hypothetical protein
MITIKTNVYTDAEKKALDFALQLAMNKFIGEYCASPCRECAYRRVCYDLDSARRYTNKIAREGETL